MNSTVVNQVLGYLNNLGKAIASGAKESFMIIVKQQVTIGIVDSLMSLVGIIVFAIVGFILYRNWKDYDIKGSWDETGGFLLLFMAIALAISGLCLFALSRSLMHIMNPEFFAIQYILSTITGNN